jgi:hypothetical protein
MDLPRSASLDIDAVTCHTDTDMVTTDSQGISPTFATEISHPENRAPMIRMGADDRSEAGIFQFYI